MTRSVTLLDRRVVAAIQLTGPLGENIAEPVGLACDGGKWLDKGNGLFVLQRWDDDPELSQIWESQVSAFGTGTKSLEFTLQPASNRFLPRKAKLALPRDPDPANSDNADSLFQPAAIPLAPTTGYSLGGNAAAVIATLRRQGDNNAIEGAVIRLREAANGPIRAIGITNIHGEALLIAAGLGLSAPGGGAAASPTHDLVAQALVDTNVASFHAAPPSQPGSPVNPDSIQTAVAPADIVSVNTSVRAGHVTAITLQWNGP